MDPNYKTELMGCMHGAVSNLARAKVLAEMLREDKEYMMPPHTAHELAGLVNECLTNVPVIREVVSLFLEVASHR